MEREQSVDVDAELERIKIIAEERQSIAYTLASDSGRLFLSDAGTRLVDMGRVMQVVHGEVRLDSPNRIRFEDNLEWSVRKIAEAARAEGRREGFEAGFKAGNGYRDDYVEDHPELVEEESKSWLASLKDTP